MSGFADNRIKENLSTNFIQIIGHLKGYKFTKTEHDDGIDLKVFYTEEIRIGDKISVEDSERFIDLQLKSTTERNVLIQGKYLAYNLRVSNYNKLVGSKKRRKIVPYILILFILPESKSKWVDLKANQINLKKHCFWFVPSDDLEVDYVKEKNDKIKILIPIENKVNLNSFDHFFSKLIPS